jgi:hypothetical protein
MRIGRKEAFSVQNSRGFLFLSLPFLVSLLDARREKRRKPEFFIPFFYSQRLSILSCVEFGSMMLVI